MSKTVCPHHAKTIIRVIPTVGWFWNDNKLPIMGDGSYKQIYRYKINRQVYQNTQPNQHIVYLRHVYTIRCLAYHIYGNTAIYQAIFSLIILLLTTFAHKVVQ